MNTSDKIQTIVLFILGVGLLGCLVYGLAQLNRVDKQVHDSYKHVSTEVQKLQSENTFTQAPPEIIHTARVYEDGSYVIEYKDGTSETGCNKGGLCND